MVPESQGASGDEDAAGAGADLKNESERLPREVREHGQRRLIQYVATGAIAGQFSYSSSPLFLLALGATPFHIGLQATVQSLGSLARLAGLRAMPHLGKVRTLAWGRRLAGIGPLLLIPVALLGDDGSATGVWLALGFLALRHVFMQGGGAAWWPLVQDSTAGSSIALFITRQRMTQRAAALTVPLAAGWYLGSQPSVARFAVPFALMVVLMVVGSVLVRGVSERAMLRSQQGYWKRLAGALQVPAIRRFCTCFGVCQLAFTMMVPFWVVLLRDRGIPVNYYVWMISLSALGEILTLRLWARLVEAHGSRSALASLAVVGLAAPVWFTLPTGPTSLIVWACMLYFIWGLLQAGWSFGETKAMLDAVPRQYQGEGFVVIQLVLAVVGGVAGVAGGVTFEWVRRLEPLESGTEPAIIYLAAVQMLLLVGWALSTRLVGSADQAPLTALLRQAAVRAVRRSR